MKSRAAPAGSPAQPLAIRIVKVTVVVVIVLVFCRIIVRHRLSEAFFGEAQISTAFAINPRDGITAGYFAWTLERTGHSDVAVPLARQAIAQTTLSAAAIGTLALAGQGGRLLEFATAAGWRDPLVQARLARSALERGDAAQAALHIDAAARIQGPNGETRTLIDHMANSPAMRAAIVGRLLLSPPWRGPYFWETSPPVGSIAARAAILEALVGTAHPPDKIEVAAVTGLGFRTYGLPYGYDVWRRLTRPRVVGFVSDPDFADATDDPDNANPYLWSLTNGPGVSTEIVQEGGRSALHVTADGLSTTPVAAQMFKVTPGRHRLSVSGRYNALRARSGFRWSLMCWNGQKATTMLSPLSGDATGNAGFEFDVPGGTCPVLRLQLSTQAASSPGQIEAWFNAVHLG